MIVDNKSKSGPQMRRKTAIKHDMMSLHQRLHMEERRQSLPIKFSLVGSLF